MTFRPLVAQAGVPVTAGDRDVDGAAAAVELLGAALAVEGGLEELAGLEGVDDELDDDPQPAARPTQISAAVNRPASVAGTRPVPRSRLPDRSRIGNTPVPPSVAPRALSRKV